MQWKCPDFGPNNAYFERFGGTAFNDLVPVVNGGLEFDTNLKTQTVDVAFNAVNGPITIKHRFNRRGINYIVVDKNVPCDIYHDHNSDDNNSIVLKSTAIAKVTLVLF